MLPSHGLHVLLILKNFTSWEYLSDIIKEDKAWLMDDGSPCGSKLEGNGLMVSRYTDDCIRFQSVAFT